MSGPSASRTGKRARACAIALLVLIFLFFPSLFGPPLRAQSGPTVRITPASLPLAPGGRATFEVRVENVSELYGADVRLSFTPARLNVLDDDPGQPGIQITPGPLLTSGAGGYFLLRQIADNQAGTIWYALTQVNPSPPVTGSGVLARVTVVGMSTGTSALHFTSVTLCDRYGRTLTAQPQDSKVDIVPVTAVTLSSLSAASGLAERRAGFATLALGLMLGFILVRVRRTSHK